MKLELSSLCVQICGNYKHEGVEIKGPFTIELENSSPVRCKIYWGWKMLNSYESLKAKLNKEDCQLLGKPKKPLAVYQIYLFVRSLTMSYKG